MSIRVDCPSCHKQYNLAENMQGKKVLCRACQSSIIIPPAGKGRREEGSRKTDERIATSSRPASAAGRANRDEDDDEPRRRPAQRRSRRDRDSEGGKNLLPILLGVGAGLLVLVGLVVGGIVLLVVGRSGSSSQPTAVTNETPPALANGKAGAAPGPAVPFNAPAAVPAPNPPAGAVAGLPAKPAPQSEPAIPPGPVPADMAADVVKKVKQSTIYVRVSMSGGEVAQGSGFFALERGIAITNAHVVGMLESDNPPRGVEVVVHSGETGEFKLASTLLGIDRDNDLAVLRVQGDLSRLPEPLPVASAAELAELQKVYIFGFPFGAQLGKDITVSPSAVSSLRKENGVLKQVQVNGGMSPGNSGGPVTDARGAVIGVSVAGIRGTQINFAVPSDFIRPLVQRGKSSPLDLTPRPMPFARNNPLAGPAPGSGLAGDLAALKGTWQSGPVGADGGGAMGSLKISISPQAGGRGGRIHVEIATKQGGRTTSSGLTYSFTLEQKGGERILVTNSLKRAARGNVRGMVFLYRFENGQLILSGVVASNRFGYTLKNVALRRTSAEPEMGAPANPANPAAGTPIAGGKGKGSADALKIQGDVFAFVAEAIRDRRLATSDFSGFTLHKNTYTDLGAEDGVLMGFQVGLGKFANNAIVKSLRPIFLTKNGEKLGKWNGPASASPITVKAKPGYVVSEVSVRAGLTIDALRLTFAKLGKDGVDLKDNYNSEWVGGNGGRPSSIGGKGALYVGVSGHLAPSDGATASIGLVAVLPKE